MALTKKDLKEIKDVVVEATEPYFTAIKEDFNNIDDRFDKIDGKFDKIDGRFNEVDGRFNEVDGRFNEVDGRFNEVMIKLSSLERRIIFLEDMSTEHGKDLRGIRAILTQLKKQKKVDEGKIILLEKRVARIEAAVA